MISQPERWQRIRQYRPAGGQHALFISKLMDEQNWDRAFAEKATDEYLRFSYLACISPIQASPSKVVDTVWHLHLTFSRDYWQCFCPEVLGKDLHHEPSDSSETPRMQQQYHATLELYEREFGTTAPQPIWHGKPPVPATTERWAWPWLAALAAVLGTGVAIAADGASSGDNDGLIAFGAIGLLILILWLLFRPRRRKRRKDDSGSGSGCSSSCSSSCGSSCGGGGD